MRLLPLLMGFATFCSVVQASPGPPHEIPLLKGKIVFGAWSRGADTESLVLDEKGKPPVRYHDAFQPVMVLILNRPVGVDEKTFQDLNSAFGMWVYQRDVKIPIPKEVDAEVKEGRLLMSSFRANERTSRRCIRAM